MAVSRIRNFGFVLGLGLLAGLPLAAFAQAVTQDQVIADLLGEGFTVIETGTTLLGRIRITAEGPEGTREVVVNPRNGKVLRDVIIDEAPEVPADVAPPVAPAPDVPLPVPVVPEAAPETAREVPAAEAAAAPSVADVGRAATAFVTTEPLPALAQDAQDRAVERSAD